MQVRKFGHRWRVHQFSGRSLLSLMTLASSLHAQAIQVEFDLSSDTEPDQEVEPGAAIKIVLSNAVPAYRYVITETRAPTPEASLPDFPVARKLGVPTCPLQSWYSVLSQHQEIGETDVKQPAQSIRDALAAGDSVPNCSVEQVALARYAESRTHRTKDVGPYDAGFTITLTITRLDGSETKRWTRRLRTPSDRGWDLSYGFTFVGEYFGKGSQSFFVQQTDAGFLIRQKSETQPIKFAPSVLFSYQRLGGASWELLPVTGLGIDASTSAKPLVFLGLGIAHRRNVGLVLGLALSPTRRLKEQYLDPADRAISENLTEDQITHEPYRFNPIFGLSFRFSSTPFSRPQEGEQKEKPGETQKPTP